MKIIPTKLMPNDTGKFVTAQMNGNILTFDEYPGQEFDLTDMQGSEPKRLRFTTDKAGVISVDALKDYWLFAEIDLPEKTYTSEPALDEAGEPVLDGNGMAKTISVAVPVAADNLKITAWELPKGAK